MEAVHIESFNLFECFQSGTTQQRHSFSSIVWTKFMCEQLHLLTKMKYLASTPIHKQYSDPWEIERCVFKLEVSYWISPLDNSLEHTWTNPYMAQLHVQNWVWTIYSIAKDKKNWATYFQSSAKRDQKQGSFLTSCGEKAFRFREISCIAALGVMFFEKVSVSQFCNQRRLKHFKG